MGKRPVSWVEAGNVTDRIDRAHDDFGVYHRILDQAPASGGKRLAGGGEPGAG